MTPRGVKLGHVHLKVRDLERAVEFYTELLDMRVTERLGHEYAFLSAGDAHHDLALQAVGPRAQGPAHAAVGLRHVAFELPDKHAFAALWHKLSDARAVATAMDHRISWSIHLADPDGNGLELYVDTRADVGGSNVWAGASVPLEEARIAPYAE